MTDFHTGLGKNAANYQPLTPIDFVIRSAQVYPDKTAIIYDDLEHNELTQTWQQTYERCRKLSDGLRKLGIDKKLPWRLCCQILRLWLRPLLAYPCQAASFVP